MPPVRGRVQEARDGGPRITHCHKERVVLSIHTVLHPTDFSDRSRNAFELACALARDYGARLIVLHAVAPWPALAYGDAVPPPDPDIQRREAEVQLDRLEVPHADVRVERRLENGEPAEVVLRVAREVGASLIVLGTHGRTGLGRLLMGSVAEQVVRADGCPVLTVTAPVPGTSRADGVMS